MALEVVGGAFLSALFQKMASGEVLDFLRGKKRTNQLLKKLDITLLSTDAVVEDAEVQQLTDSRVKKWLSELKDAVFHAEDLLDEIKTEALRCKQLKPGSGSITRKVRKHITSVLYAFDHTTLNSRIEAILDMLEFIVKQKDTLNLKTDGGPRISETILPPSTTSLVESDVCGRDEEKESFIKLLLSDDATGNNISVLPIVGMGGIGKTTFAQLIYNDVRVTKHFAIQAWVCVSEKFDVVRITQTIYESITEQPCDMMNLDMLQRKLKEALTGKKFLFVHDDVWNENYIDWNSLRQTFESGVNGSKIIVTTRNEGVASMMGGTLQTHRLMQISEEDCWFLFAKHAFENATDSARSNLEVIGRQIARKSKGLPLAAKSLGGLLRSKLNMEEWEDILNSEIWDFSLEESKILPALWLSYYHLPPYLKRCFAYCSIYPKNHVFKKSELILLWKAEDLLQPKKEKMVEEVGESYFDYLIARSFFQHVDDHYGESKFSMHDLINDLAKFVSGDFCVRWEDNDSPKIVSKTRHFSCMEKYSSRGFEKFEALYEAKCLRTFLPCQKYVYGHKLRQLDAKVLHDFFSKLQYLRVLNLAGYDLKELPDSIDKLKHLRHLDLSYTSIEKLPDTVCTLYNLQTLLLSHCKALTQLPTNLGRLMKLRHLDIEGTKLQKMPPHMGKLKDLRILSDFVLDKHTAGHDISELKELQFLRGTLRISGLGNLVHVKDALEVNIMRDKKYLNELELKWEPSVTDDSHQEKEREVLEKLQPHTNLKRLVISSYGGTTFPSWLGPETPKLTVITISGCEKLRSLLEEMHSLLPSLQSLKIYNCPELESFPEGGLPSKLKSLWIRSCKKLMANRMQWGLPRLTSLTHLTLGFEDCEEVVDDSFPEEGLLPTTLTFLSIEGLLNVKKMDGKGFRHLNSLQTLWIFTCPELQCLPDEGLLNSLSALVIDDCPLLSERCERDKGEDWPKIAHIPKIWIDWKRI